MHRSLILTRLSDLPLPRSALYMSAHLAISLHFVMVVCNDDTADGVTSGINMNTVSTYTPARSQKAIQTPPEIAASIQIGK